MASLLHAQEYSQLPPESSESLSPSELSELVALSKHDLIPNQICIDETDINKPTCYTSLNNLFPENTFCYAINDSECVRLVQDYSPTSLLLEIGPREESSLYDNSIGTIKKKRRLESDSDGNIISFAFNKHPHSPKIAVGRMDGTIIQFDIKNETYYERNCSSYPITSITFDNEGFIIATDTEKKVYFINTVTNLLLTIINNNKELLCPSLEENQILVVQQHEFKLSPAIPIAFFHHKVTSEQYSLLTQFADIKRKIRIKEPLDHAIVKELSQKIEKSTFEPMVQKELNKRLEVALKISKPHLITSLQQKAFTCFQKIQQCYTNLLPSTTIESTAGESV